MKITGHTTTPVFRYYDIGDVEALCASAPVRLDNAFFAESRTGRPGGAEA